MVFRTNGVTGTPYASTAPVRIARGNPIGVTLRYDGTTLWLTLTDAVAQVSFSTSYAVNLPALFGTNTGYVGLTGADGGLTSTQRVSDFLFASLPALSLATSAPGVFRLSWPTSAAGLVQQSRADLHSGAWAPVLAPVTVVNGRKQVSISPLTGAQFYRLGLP